MTYNTALRGHTAKRIEEISTADIIVGIPCYNNETNISHVIQMVTHGLAKHYADKRSVIFIADDGSTDDTREAAPRNFKLSLGKKKLFPYTGDRPGRALLCVRFLRRRNF